MLNSSGHQAMVPIITLSNIHMLLHKSSHLPHISFQNKYPKAKRDLAMNLENVEAGLQMNTSANNAAVRSPLYQLKSEGIN